MIRQILAAPGRGVGSKPTPMRAGSPRRGLLPSPTLPSDSIRRRQAWLWLALSVFLAACTSPQPATPTLIPTATLPPFTVTPKPTATSQATATPLPTEAPRPTPTLTFTPLPTRPPDAEPGDAQWRDWQTAGYKLDSSASTIGPKGFTYSVYLWSRDESDRPAKSYGLAFYLWDGYSYKLIEKQDMAEGLCVLTDWDSAEFRLVPTSQERIVLNLHGRWSDINNNGLPEIALERYAACSACNETNVTTQFYEIRDSQMVVEITESIPDILTPGFLLHTANPLTIQAYEITYYGTGSSATMGIRRIYQWDGTQYVNVTAYYPEEYEAEVASRVALIKKQYGKAFHLVPGIQPFLEILLIYNEAHLLKQSGLQTFLEVTNPSHWPGTEPIGLCWLQLARAYAQMDYEKNVPFRLYTLAEGPFVIGGSHDQSPWDLTEQDIDTARFDVSACK
jgi:hypothetical protein